MMTRRFSCSDLSWYVGIFFCGVADDDDVGCDDK